MQKVPDNVEFAHLVRSDNPLNFGLGAQHWQGPQVTETIINDLHPGDGNTATQDSFIADIKQRMLPGHKTYLFGMYGQFGAAADPVNFVAFLRRVADEGVHIMHSPYRDFQTQLIADQIKGLTKEPL